jgi:RNA polymerase sigma-70 factor (ECF subfamily)
MPFYLWLRRLALQRLIDLDRRHLQAEARDVRRELPLRQWKAPEGSTQSMAAALVGKEASPVDAALAAERIAAVRTALDAMDPLDREVILLRHFEGLTNPEAAGILDMEESAVGSRFYRALKKLGVALERLGIDLRGGSR